MNPFDDPSKRPASGWRRRIPSMLIVDDEPLVGAALGRTLADEFAVVVASSGNEAFERVRFGASFDVILCDVNMPAMDGVELLERLRESEPSLAARVIFMTGGLTDHTLRERVESLPNLLLEKPLDLDALRALVRRRAGGCQAAGSGGAG
ncbi:MAG: response regulator [Polyangiaceae bacterium]